MRSRGHHFPPGDINNTGNPAFIAQVGALAMGASTSAWMQRHAGNVSARTGSAWPYTQPTWVFSSRAPAPIPGANLQFVHGDVRPVHAATGAAAGQRNIWIVGGGDLAGQFCDADLLDEIIIQVGTVTLGQGKPLFPRRLTSPPLRLASARPIGPGFAELRYAVPKRTPTSSTPMS